MDYPLKFAAQLKEQLRSLRKARGLSQADLGALVGVNQRRIADIEADPGVVGFDQIVKLLAALGAEIVVRDLATASTPATGAAPRPTAPAGDDRPAPEVHVVREERVAPAGLGRPPTKGAW